MTVRYIISGVRNDKGFIRGAAFAKNDGAFPDDPKRAYALAESKAQRGTVELLFKDINLSPCAFSFFHDEKDIKTLEKNFLGIPKQGIGVSNWSGKGRPKYSSCLIKPERVMRVALKYF